MKPEVCRSKAYVLPEESRDRNLPEVGMSKNLKLEICNSKAYKLPEESRDIDIVPEESILENMTPEVCVSKEYELPEGSRDINIVPENVLPEASKSRKKITEDRLIKYESINPKTREKVRKLPEESKCVYEAEEVEEEVSQNTLVGNQKERYIISGREEYDIDFDAYYGNYELRKECKEYSSGLCQMESRNNICQNMTHYKIVDNSEIYGHWTNEEMYKSSTWRELEALRRVLINSTNKIKKSTVKFCTDNKNVKYILTTGSNVEILHKLSLEIHDICDKQNISFIVEWIPREENTKADYLSRCLDSDDWTISDEIFNLLNRKWGPYTIDRFASNYNNKCIRFNSRWWVPGTEAVDSFKQEWSREINWIVPPPKCIIQCIKKLENEKSKATLIIPKWESATFWSFIIQGNGSYRDFIKDIYMFPILGAVNQGRSSNGIFNKEPFSFRMMALKCDFT